MDKVTLGPFSPQSQKGFSLIEVLISITILSIGLLGLAALQVHAIRGNALGKKNTLAVALAEEKMEEVRNTPYASIGAGTTTETSVNGRIYDRVTTVEDNTPATDMKRITVEVTWDDFMSHRVRLRTIIAQNG